MRTIIRDLVLWLVDDHINRLHEESGPDTAERRLLYALSGEYPTSKPYIERLLSSEACDLVAERQFVHMPPVSSEGWLLPVLGVTFDFTNRPERISLQVAMFRPPDDEDGRPMAVGYRFESPEGVAGMHCYWHVQPIQAIRAAGDDKRFKLPVPDWMPVKQPAMPLDADNSVALFVAMLVSLYGDTVGLRLRQHGLINAILPHVENVRFKCCWTEPA